MMVKILAFFVAGIAEPLRYGWRIVAARQGPHETINALIVLSPSFVGITAGVWFATKLG